MIDLRYKINDLILHTSESKICYQDRELCIEPRLVNLLSFLAKHPETVFTRLELINSVWEGAVVTEQVVTQSVFELRKLLAECNHAGIITTIPKRGYKLSAAVTEIYHEDLSCNCEQPSEKQTLEQEETVESVTPFPSGPLTRAVSSFNCQKETTLCGLINKIPNRVFDVFILLTLISIISYLTLYNHSDTPLSEYDTQLIAIKTVTNDKSSDNLGYLAYGISKQLQKNLHQFSQYRTRYTNHTPMVAGKQLIVSMLYERHKTFLSIKLYSQTLGRDIYASRELINNDNLVAVIRREILDTLDALQVPLSAADRQSLVSEISTDPKQLKQKMLIDYFISQPEFIAKGIKLLNKMLEKNPQNSQALALRYISYAEMTALDGQLPEQNLLNHYANALNDYLNQYPAPDNTTFWNAIALSALYQGKDEQARQALKKSRQLAGDYNSLGYIILGKLQQKTHPALASESFSQAYYLNSSQRTYKLCQSLAWPSQLSLKVPVLAKLN